MPPTPPPAPRFHLPMQVCAGDLTLRRLLAEDTDELFETITASLDHLRPWMEWAREFSRATVEEFVNSAAARDDGPVSDAPYLVRTATGELVGTCGLHGRLGPNALEIGYWTAAAHTRRGYTTVAAAALTDAAFTVPEVRLVEIHHDVGNTASGAIPARLGYEHVGSAAVRQEVPAGTGRHWHWRITRAAWPTSAGARLLEAARATTSGRPR